MRYLLIFVTLIICFVLPFQTFNASCESEFHLNGRSYKPLSMGANNFMARPKKYDKPIACKGCNTLFIPKRGNNVFCTKKCFNEHFNPKNKKIKIQVCCLNCNTLFVTPLYETKVRQFCSEQCYRIYNRGETSQSRKINLTYEGIHSWVRVNYGKATKCEICNISGLKRYHWASLNHTYERDITKWKQVCPKCHAKIDGRNKPIYQLDENRMIINKWDTALEASTGISANDKMIWAAITRNRMYHGFYWEYQENYKIKNE